MYSVTSSSCFNMPSTCLKNHGLYHLPIVFTWNRSSIHEFKYLSVVQWMVFFSFLNTISGLIVVLKNVLLRDMSQIFSYLRSIFKVNFLTRGWTRPKKNIYIIRKYQDASLCITFLFLMSFLLNEIFFLFLFVIIYYNVIKYGCIKFTLTCLVY